MQDRERIPVQATEHTPDADMLHTTRAAHTRSHLWKGVYLKQMLTTALFGGRAGVPKWCVGLTEPEQPFP